MKTVHEQFGDFTEIFAADGYQFLKMRQFLESIEKKPIEARTVNEQGILQSFTHVSNLCRFFLDQNPKI